MANFNDLPAELIAKICRALCPHCAALDLNDPSRKYWIGPGMIKGKHVLRHALLNLSLVCKRVSAEAQAFLYHTFGLDPDLKPRLHQFYRTILERPDLAECVKDATLSHVVESPWATWEEVSWIEPVIERSRSKLNFEAIPAGRHTDRIRTVLPAATLLQLPRLKRLTVSGRDGKHLFDYIKRQIGSPGKLLTELQFLWVYIPDAVEVRRLTPYRPLSISEEHLGGFLSEFPSLRTLVLSNVQNSTVPQHLKLSSVQSLSFHDSRLSKESLGRLINATGDLGYFKYGDLRGIDFVADAGLDLPLNNETPATSHEIFTLLETKKDTLTDLELFMQYRGVTDQMSEPDGNFAPLSRLNSLHKLKMNVRTFYNPVPFVQNDTYPDDNLLFSHLPPVLNKLHIVSGPGGFKRILPALEKFCEDTPENPLTLSAKVLKEIRVCVTATEAKWELAHDVDEDFDLSPLAIQDIMKPFQRTFDSWTDNEKRLISVSKHYRVNRNPT